MSELSRIIESNNESSNKLVMEDISEMVNSAKYVSKINSIGFYDHSREIDVLDQSLDTNSPSSPFVSNPDIGLGDISGTGDLLQSLSSNNDEEDEGNQIYEPFNNGVNEDIDPQDQSESEQERSSNTDVPLAPEKTDTVADETFLSELSQEKDDDKDNTAGHVSTSSIPRNKNRSPWRTLRTTLNNSNLGNPGKIPNLHFHDLTPGLRKSVGTNKYEAASSFSRVHELNKEITGYRIQIKFFKQFLQDLIDRSGQIDGLVHGQLDLGDLAKIQDTVDQIEKPSQDNQFLELQKKYDTLAKNYDEIYSLNRDLYKNLETFEHNLKSKEELLQDLQQYTQDCEVALDGILDDIIKNSQTDALSRQALLKCQGSQGAKMLSMKAQVIKLELGKIFETKIKGKYPSPPSSNRERGSEDFSVHAHLMQTVLSSLDRIQNDYADSKSETKKLESELKSEIASSKTVIDNYMIMQETLQQISRTMEDKAGRDPAELMRLESENKRLASSLKDMEDRFFEYKKISEELQEEVNALRSSRFSILGSRRDSSFISSTHDFELQGELLTSHKEYKQLNQDYIQLSTDFNKLKHESSEKITNLKNDLQSKQHELNMLRSNEKSYENLKHDLEIAVEKQRILKAENIRQSYSIESLTNDKISLSSTIKSLTDKIALLTVPTSHEKSESVSKKLNILEYQLEDLMFFDVQEFQRLLKSFNKIADDSSLKEPKRKIDSLARKFARDERPPKLDVEHLNVVRDYHKSVFNYFARAVDIIINDHVKLLLKDNEHPDSEAHLDSLIAQIDSLRAENTSLTKKLNNMSNTRETSTSSPRYQLRIDELTNRWKAEREARVYENKESLKRLEELEAENAKLKSRSS